MDNIHGDSVLLIYFIVHVHRTSVTRGGGFFDATTTAMRPVCRRRLFSHLILLPISILMLLLVLQVDISPVVWMAVRTSFQRLGERISAEATGSCPGS